MMQSCPSCGFEGQPGARFCRQCGTPLFVEREANLAATRHHPSTANPPRSQGWPMPGARDPESAETSRFWLSSSHTTPPYTVPQPNANAGAFRALVATVCGVAAAGVIMASLFSSREDRIDRSARTSIAAAIKDEIRRETERGARQAEELARISEEKARATADVARAAEELAQAKAKLGVPAPPAPPAPLPVPRVAAISLEQLTYPGAAVISRISTGGTANVMKLETSDNLDKVVAFYTVRLGAPQSANKTRVTFARSQQGGDLLVKVSQGTNGKTAVSLARSSSKNLP